MLQFSIPPSSYKTRDYDSHPILQRKLKIKKALNRVEDVGQCYERWPSMCQALGLIPSTLGRVERIQSAYAGAFTRPTSQNW